MGAESQINPQGQTGWPEQVLVANEPNDLRDVEDKLIEEGYLEVLEYRSIDSGCEHFQVLAHTLKSQPSESGEYKSGRWRYRSISSFGLRRRGSEFDGKGFELWQRRQGCGHGLRWDVPRIRYIVEMKRSEMSCRHESSWD
jgi:hypothetical protein